MIRFVLALLLAAPAAAQPSPVTADPPVDVVRPAGMEAFAIPVDGGALNAVLYTAAGAGPHPALLLLHGFPGNEQNLDLAQAARRAGWHVLTFHYRGSWGSPGGFSFAHSAQDAQAALAWLRGREVAERFGVDPARIVVAGHSMGGMMAAVAAARDPKVAGLALLDPWDISETAGFIETAQGRADWRREAAADVVPLSGTSVEALTAEIEARSPLTDLGAQVAAYGPRPLILFGARRGGWKTAERMAGIARAAGNAQVAQQVLETDHGFNDQRVTLASALVEWLGALPPAR